MRTNYQQEWRAIAFYPQSAWARFASSIRRWLGDRRPEESIFPVVIIFLLSLVGCQRTAIFASDAFVVADSQVMLSANVIRGTSPTDCRGVPGVPVRFYHEDKLLGEAITADCGTARLTAELPPPAKFFRGEAEVGEHQLRAEGSIFIGSPSRTTIVCDIDGTISATHYRELVFDNEDDASQPLPGAADTLNELREHYGLIYVTARPGFLRAKTLRWLEVHGFPKAPLIGTAGLRQSVTPQRFKSETIMRLQEALGNLRIGIGDAKTDSEAYAMEGLLPILINNYDDNRFRSHAVVLRDWRMVRAFFYSNREILQDPDRLQAAVEGEEMLMRPILRYQPPRRRTPRETFHQHAESGAP